MLSLILLFFSVYVSHYFSTNSDSLSVFHFNTDAVVCVFLLEGYFCYSTRNAVGSNQSKLLHSRKVGPGGYVTFTQHAFAEACCWEFLPENKVAWDRSLRNLLLTAT